MCAGKIFGISEAEGFFESKQQSFDLQDVLVLCDCFQRSQSAVVIFSYEVLEFRCIFGQLLYAWDYCGMGNASAYALSTDSY